MVNPQCVSICTKILIVLVYESLTFTQQNSTVDTPGLLIPQQPAPHLLILVTCAVNMNHDGMRTFSCIYRIHSLNSEHL
jgi:hypothetical protein